MYSAYIDEDIAEVKLIPGKRGSECPGNGEHFDSEEKLIECCCDECDCYLECFPEFIK